MPRAVVSAGPGRPSLLLPVASALLLALAPPPFELPLLAFVGLAPLGLYLARCGAGRRGRRHAVRGAALFGVVHFGAGLYWIPVALARFSWLALPAWLATVAVLSALMAGVGWLVHGSVRRVGLPLWAALPVAWTAGEWVRAHLPGGLAFPWMELGVSLAPWPELAGAAELVGSRGLSFWMALVGGLLATAAARQARGSGRLAGVGSLLAAVAVTALPMLWGARRAATLPLLPAAEVVVAQPGVDAELRLDADRGWAATRAALDTLLGEVGPGTAELVALPEVTVRGDPRTPEGRAAASFLQRHARRLGAPMIFGALGRGRPGAVAAGPVPESLDAAPSGPLHNSAFLVTPDGLGSFRYDKRRLVPGVEAAPPWVAEILPGEGAFREGRRAPLVEGGGVLHGVLICFESTFAGLARDYRRNGAHLLLNLTNDAWFGAEPRWARTTALWQHPAHLVMRAIENRMGVARAAATGISLFVDPVGRVHGATPLFRPAVRVHDPGTTAIRTVYTRHGDLVGRGAAGAAALLALLGGFPGRGRIRNG